MDEAEAANRAFDGEAQEPDALDKIVFSAPPVAGRPNPPPVEYLPVMPGVPLWGEEREPGEVVEVREREEREER